MSGAKNKIKKLGIIEAGFPSPAEEELLDTMTLDEWLIKRREATYMLEVKGQSMMNAGILPGDTALVERGRDPKHGDIVIACVDGKWTMKYYHILANKKIVLVPANPKFAPIYPQEELLVEAIVTAIIRKY
jgi:repressor LexA